MRQRRHSHKNELAYKPEKRRWFLNVEDGALSTIHERFCYSFEISSKYIEIPESELKYWWNKPEGEWEVRKPKTGEEFLDSVTLQEHRACLNFITKYRWCRPLKDRFDVMAEEILEVYRASPASNRIQSIAYYLRNNWEKEIK